jgi:hypothetical protein
MSIFSVNLDIYEQRVDGIDMTHKYVDFFHFFRHICHKMTVFLHNALPEAPAMTEFDPKLPYNDLPPLPPPVELIETKEILKQCIAARVALAELKQAAELIPNSAVLVNALPLLEARASSEIENIVTTTDKLFEFADIAEDKADAATKEALRYRTALYEVPRRKRHCATARRYTRAPRWSGGVC